MEEGEDFHIDFYLGGLETKLKELHKEIQETKEYD